MAKSKETFGKKEKEKQRLKRKQDKMEKMEERKASAKKGKSLDEMMAYIDENGNLSSTPPDPRKIKVFKAEEMNTGVPVREEGGEEPGRRVGGVPAVQRLGGHPLLQPGDQRIALVADPDRLVLGLGRVLHGHLDLLLFVDQGDLGEGVVSVDDGDHLRGGHLLESAAQSAAEIQQKADRHNGEQDPYDGSAE